MADALSQTGVLAKLDSSEQGRIALSFDTEQAGFLTGAAGTCEFSSTIRRQTSHILALSPAANHE
ncbi:hypothetical protein [Halothiobacillus sp.]|jgi:hypothetical protein|uniref:hypothetical protein n=1 Tax=Halothiobacillus sp. TaxID=1891311 RepID=UPI0029830132|nr:hypothetical protein [Halothiobacillus sp.]MDY0146821.1 hypothetical protein [Halothiobacillus sp.]